jgi:hypothetical protein
LVRGEGREQHDARVVDQDVGAAELGLDPRSCRGNRVAVGDIGLDRNRLIAELGGQGLDAVGPACQQRQTVTVGGQGPRGGFADAR